MSSLPKIVIRDEKQNTECGLFYKVTIQYESKFRYAQAVGLARSKTTATTIALRNLADIVAETAKDQD